MPNITCGVLNVDPPTLIMKPTPSLDAISSATTTPTTARPEACRMPVKIYGTAPGTMTVRARPPTRAEARDHVEQLRLAHRAPVRALIAIGNSVTSTTRKILNPIPIPNQRMKSG